MNGILLFSLLRFGPYKININNTNNIKNMNNLRDTFEKIQDLEFQMKLQNLENNPEEWIYDIFMLAIDTLLMQAKNYAEICSTEVNKEFINDIHTYRHEFIEKHQTSEIIKM